MIAAANGVELCYDTIGDPGDPPLVLIMGLGLQLVHWPDALCRLLAGEGFRVIRFDNRERAARGRARRPSGAAPGSSRPSRAWATTSRPARGRRSLRP